MKKEEQRKAQATAAEECGSGCLPHGRSGSNKQDGQPKLSNFQNLANMLPLVKNHSKHKP